MHLVSYLFLLFFAFPCPPNLTSFACIRLRFIALQCRSGLVRASTHNNLPACSLQAYSEMWSTLGSVASSFNEISDQAGASFARVLERGKQDIGADDEDNGDAALFDAIEGDDESYEGSGSSDDESDDSEEEDADHDKQPIPQTEEAPKSLPGPSAEDSASMAQTVSEPDTLPKDA